MKRRIGVFVSFCTLTACGMPVTNDVAEEIMDASHGVIGKTVALKTSATFKLESLADASRAFLGSGWQQVKGEVCKGTAPARWVSVRAFDYSQSAVYGKSDQVYNLRICATQLADPKRIAAIGFVVSTQKVKPFKP